MHLTSLHKWLNVVLRDACVRVEKAENRLDDVEKAGKSKREEPTTGPSENFDRVARAEKAEEKARAGVAIEREKEIIEAIERAKKVLGEKERAESEVRNDNFEYRPEGMFPPPPKPVDKKEKVKMLHSAYGVKASGNKLPPAVKKVVKPSESKYTFKKPMTSGISKNPNKITTDTKQKQVIRSMSGSSQPPKQQRSTSKQAPNPPVSKETQKNIRNEEKEVKVEGKPPLRQKTPTRKNVLWTEFQERGKNEEMMGELIPSERKVGGGREEEMDDSTQGGGFSSSFNDGRSRSGKPRDELPSISQPKVLQMEGKDGWSRAGNERMQAVVRRIQSAKVSSGISMESHSLLQQMSKIDSLVTKLRKQYEQDVRLEEKRTNIEAIVRKTMRDYRLFTKLLARDTENKLNQQEGSDDEDATGHLTRPLVTLPPLQRLDELPALDSETENEDYIQICEFGKEGLFDRESEAYGYLIEDLSSPKQSPAVQSVLSKLYSCWFYSEHFISSYHGLKEARQRAQKYVEEVVEKLDNESITKHISSILPDERLRLPQTSVSDDGREMGEGIGGKETDEEWTDEVEAEYFTRVREAVLPGLKERFRVLKAGGGRDKAEKMAEMKSFLLDVRLAYQLFNPHSKLPLIFHSNFEAVD